MIQEIDAQYVRRGSKPPGDLVVFCGGLKIPRRMIVGDNYRAGTVKDGIRENFPGVYNGTIHKTYGDSPRS